MKYLFFLCLLILLFAVTITAQEQYGTSEGEKNYSRMGLNQNLQRAWSQFPLNSSSINSGIWSEIHPLIPRVDYWGVDFVNADTGWAVGEGGAIIKTTSGGEKWIWYESGVENTLRTVSAVNNGQRVIAAGDGGIIIISEDRGESWTQLSSPTIRNIWNMQMITEQIGWMVGEGGTALRTTDGGLTWIQQPMPYPNSPYWDLSFIDTSFGYICSAVGIVLKTTNGGGSWQIQQAGDTRALWTICAIDTLRASGGGFAGKVVYTTDGGNNWLYAGGSPTAEINKIKFINDTTGFMAGPFYKSTDGGMSWFKIYDLYEGSSSQLTTNLSFPQGTEGYVTGAKMLLAKTTDKGESWRRTIVNADFINVYFKDEQNGFMNSSHLIYTTNDGGYTLDTLETFPYNEIFSMEAMTFTDNLTGYIGSTSLSIYKTTNSGISWYRTNINGINDTIGTISKIFFLNSVLGWATSYDDKIFNTTDAGDNWYLQLDAGITRIFKSIYFVDSLYGWATSRYIFSTTDGGTTWEELINSGILFSWDIYFINDSTGFCTESNKLYKTIDGGLNWSQDSLVSGFGQGRFTYFDSNNIFITASKVYRTTDGGYSWTEFPELEGPDWRLRISLINVNSGYLVGEMGWVVKYFDDSVTYISPAEEFVNAKDFYLFQNYPNPFNSSTLITYQIPKDVLVTLKIYDVLGNEVATLVRERKSAGSYTIEFQAENLSTGIYLYRLSAGKHSLTRKLILLK